MSMVYGGVNTYAYTGYGIPAGSVATGYTTGAPSVLSQYQNRTPQAGQVALSKDYLPLIAVSIQRERQLFNNWTGVGGAPPTAYRSLPNPATAQLAQRQQTLVSQSSFSLQASASAGFPFLGPFTGPGGLPQGPDVLGPFGGPGGLPQGPGVLGPFGGPGGLPQGPGVLGPFNGPGGLPQGPDVLGPFNGPGGLPQGPNVLGPFNGPGGLPQGPGVLGPFGGPGGLPFASPSVLGPFGGPGGLPSGPNVLGPFGGPGGLPFASPGLLGPFGGPGGLPQQSPPLLGPPSFGAPNGTFPFANQFNGGISPQVTSPFPFPSQPIAATGPVAPQTQAPVQATQPFSPFPFPTTNNPISFGSVGGSGSSVGPTQRAGWGWQNMVQPTQTNIDPSVNYKNLDLTQRQALSGLSDHERAILHLWGIQMTSDGRQDGGIYLNVLQNPDQFKPAEVELARQLQARDQAQYGGVTGKALDQEFFGLYNKITGQDISQRYGNAPVNFADGPVNMDNRLTGNNGMSGFENAVIRLWGHDPLFNGGHIDGSVLSYTLDSPNALDFNLNKSDVQALLTSDLASDGVRNGDSLAGAFGGVLDKLYLGGPGASADAVQTAAIQQASQTRPFLTGFPVGGDPQRYQFMVSQLGPELGQFDASLNELAGLANVAPQSGNLEGRFENGLFMRVPADRAEFGSYNAAQIAGGALTGSTSIFQKDATPGTRYAQVQDPTMFHAATARMYAYQFAAYAEGYNPLTPDGMADGAKAFETMAPDARVFTQVASIYKGNLLNGPDNYDNPKLKELLVSKGLTELANQPGVGETDVQTVGAVTAALNTGKVTLNDVIASGSIEDMPRYREVIDYVVGGQFNQDLGRYDVLPYNSASGNTGVHGGAAGSAGTGGSTGSGGNYRTGGGLDGLYSDPNTNPYQTQVGQFQQNPVVSGFYAMFDLNGDGKVYGPETAAAVSGLSDITNLMLSGAKPGPNAPAAVQQFFTAHDFDRDGSYGVDEVRAALRDLRPVIDSMKLDQFNNPANVGRPVQVGSAQLDPSVAARIAKCPVLGPQMQAGGGANGLG